MILDAAIRVTERDGITGLTLESAAEEAGVTKGGLMYHFRTRVELLVAIQKRLTEAWEERLVAELGKPLAEATPRESTAAYLRVGTQGTTSKADLAFMVEAAASPELGAVWGDFFGRWFPSSASTGPVDLDLLLVRLVVDGWWLLEATSGSALPEPVKAALQDRLAELIETDAPRDE
ncbi:transcriptional regulator, TetR family protein [Streptomyces bingchenggensis BCW-1]|uniref:Transcriptional regulator, TetR family protein n=1 Tax=Streptomyces bingchenggensis (strain BCW-1) TaxID=749414 RepID=D7CBM2_STRBB|nr:TetR family transcriptional regulator [Streptomyces milbemycinicus]ADI12899.1 transcriptional regulator, TetR family protein [Streptomyces bingchenggensis BCW-1]